MASSSTTPADPLAEALRENQELRQLMAEQAQQLQQFLYAASHDLQEPLRGIMTYAQLLERECAATPESREYTGFIVSSAERMRQLLQQLLVYSRAGAAKHRKPANLKLPLQMALLKLAPEIREAGAKIIQPQPLPDAVFDENEIAQVFEHILRNSLRFRSAAVAPEISVSAEQGTDACTVSLRDNGTGIDPRFCEQVLLPFKRLQAHDVSGHGLGLAICAKIVRAHEGRLWVESDGVTGTTVRFTLPT